ncbi:putative surface protease GP63 [Trypanosoma grayi]|uniref:putative surface protease GP63 n=1 Tax=Trypanosoma grayi TaxID=71804 RepID=UPI0004F44573|nr:putative surface protease GP63 [Trypanosoma grayi]KEG06810.1 putative surface protease GP63 [Trypanosoma grayi]
MNFLPEEIVASRHFIRRVAHDIAHALGFSVERMAALGMVATRALCGRPVYVINTTRTVAVARKHYGCAHITGVVLDGDADDGGTSHWRWRDAKDELMSAHSSGGTSSFGAYYTALTMAIFEDMGVYRAQWGTEEPMKWGRDAGCTFLEHECTEHNAI